MTDSSRFGLMVLAAGLSRRMGGPNKLLTNYRGKPLLSYALAASTSLAWVERLVVTGRDAGAMEDIASSFGFRCVHNPAYTDGLGGSIAVGARALSGTLDGIIIALGDMPEIAAGDYRAVRDMFRPGLIAIPVHEGIRGHPVLFCASYRAELAVLRGDEGARSVVKRHAGSVVELATTSAGILRDLDRPADFDENCTACVNTKDESE
jgi:molybdenum cofactor cytidylyltransferase